MFSQAQNDYINYHLDIYKARKFNYENKLDSALILYQRAFSLVDYIHIDNLEKAQKFASKLKNDSFEIFVSSKIDSYFLTDSTINLEYKNLIDSLYYEDQKVRNGIHSNAQKTLYNSKKKNSKISAQQILEAENLMKEWHIIDSINVNLLLGLIKKHGFPSEKLVKKESYHNAFIILLHYDTDLENKILKPIIDEALIRGDINPEDYAWIIDRRLSWGQGKNQYYYFMPMGTETLTSKGISMINERRKKIGLRNLFEGIEIIKDDNSITTKTLY